MSTTERALVAADVLAHVRARWAAPRSGPTRVGVEQEWHTYWRSEPTRRCDPEEILAVAPALPSGGRVTVEPGGQVELATPALAPWHDAASVLAADAAVLRAALHEAGIATVAAGVDPYRAPWRTLHEPRYDAMEQYLDGWAPAGRRMMCSTAAIQVNVDLGDGDEPAARWRAAHAVGPALAAAFASSPSSTARCERLTIWAQLDPTRTDPALASGDPARDWAAYMLAARLLLQRDDEHCRPVREPLTLDAWLAGDRPGRAATLDDVEYHATTLFPPVRLRGWLELRWLDSVPGPLASVAVAATTAVIVDAEARRQAAAACELGTDAWERAARCGPSDPKLAAAAVTTLRAAAGALDRAGRGDLAEATRQHADRYPARGRCPADDLAARLGAGADPLDLAGEQ